MMTGMNETEVRMSRSMAFAVAALSLAVTMTPALSRAVTEDAPVLIVTPARPNMVKWALDVSSLRSAYIVSYRNAPGRQGLMLHVWDSRGKRWVQSNLESYRAGAQFARPPAVAFLLGVEAEFPAFLVSEAPFGMRTVRIDVMDPVLFANALNHRMHFSQGEWRWLASQWGFELTDLNAERRRYGRYGPPGSEPRRPPEQQPQAPQPPPTPPPPSGPMQPFAWELAPLEEIPVRGGDIQAPPPSAPVPTLPREAPATRPAELPKPGPVSRRGSFGPIMAPTDPATK
jgi:hypothetical protein